MVFMNEIWNSWACCMELSGASEPEELLRFHHIVLWRFMSIYDFHPQRYVITGPTAISKGTSCFPSIHAAGFLTSLSSLHQFAKVWADYLHFPTTKFHWINIKQPAEALSIGPWLNPHQTISIHWCFRIHGDVHLDAYSNLTLHDRRKEQNAPVVNKKCPKVQKT